MKNRVTAVLAVGALICMIPAQGFAMTAYSQDFENLLQFLDTALGDDGWFVYGNVFEADGTTFIYGYGPFPAPNDGFGFCQIDIGQGGPEQGLQQLSVFSDYNNGDHAIGRVIESNTFQEQMVTATEVGQRWKFAFQAKRGNLVAPSTATAFIKTIDPGNGDLTNLITLDMTTIPETWGGFSLYLTIDEGLVGQLIQFGFANTATLFESAGMYYDNIVWEQDEVSSVPDGLVAAGPSLRQNYPNPFNPMTRIDFALDSPGNVDLSVFDLSGRRIATLHQGNLGAGDHQVTWNGRTDSGLPAAAGQYRYVLKTATGQVSRSMVLLK